MENIEIVKVDIAYIKKLQEIGRTTFFETFSGNNSAENMAEYLEKGFSTARLTAELTSPYSGFYLALLNKEVIGYLKVNWGKAQTEIQDGNGLEIERIYVLQQYHGRKIGQLLYEQALKIAGEKRVDYVWLGVWEKNLRAIRFYEKNGFAPFGKHVFRLGNEEQTDIMMRQFLKND
ncbi:GNAT family N-acetyltransferase [Niabella sp.]|uniref:GNAT family N-acetyltransferase n=1 Tax=Niabella sp. TaxID=1962976 RepID=UPI00261DB15D|nr:GNAT family N-acetyltransferase [Niabella sp.]